MRRQLSKGSFVLLYERDLEVQVGALWGAPERMTVDADGLLNLFERRNCYHRLILRCELKLTNYC